MTHTYHYQFPKSLIASSPAKPRDSARLLVYNRKTKRVTHDVFRNLGQYLPPHSLLILNDTKVIPARLTLQKPTRGLVRVLYLGHDQKYIRVLADRKLTIGSLLSLRGTNVVSDEAISRLLRRFTPRNDEFFLVHHVQNESYFLQPSFPTNKILDVLNRFGITPLPPYIKNSTLDEKQARAEYQTVFARIPGSVAAPTASLHFTKKLLNDLRRAGHEIAYVTLHVNLGTFAPVSDDQLRTGRLHPEFFTIPRATNEAINRAKREGRHIIAVGTTAVRALESKKSPTTLFIRPSFKFKTTSGLITNFHVPRSSLLMLVAAFTGRSKLLALYRQALRRHYRLFSFGDTMLIV